jgi:hypothetical protein
VRYGIPSKAQNSRRVLGRLVGFEPTVLPFINNLQNLSYFILCIDDGPGHQVARIQSMKNAP